MTVYDGFWAAAGSNKGSVSVPVGIFRCKPGVQISPKGESFQASSREIPGGDYFRRLLQEANLHVCVKIQDWIWICACACVSLSLCGFFLHFGLPQSSMD